MKDSTEKKGESLLSTILGRTPTMEEYESAVDGIVLTRFAPPNKELSSLAAV